MLTTRAFILRSVDYGESDRIITIYTRALGRVSAIARNARSSRKRFGGALSPFAEFEAVLKPATRGQLMNLTEAVLIDAHFDLSADYLRLQNAARMLTRLRDAMGESQMDSVLFDLLAKSMSAMGHAEGLTARLVAFVFSMALTERCGFSVSINECNACGTALPPGRSTFFDPARGGVVCTACGGGPILLSAPCIALIQQLSRTNPDSACELQVNEDLLTSAEDAFDLFFRHQLR